MKAGSPIFTASFVRFFFCCWRISSAPHFFFNISLMTFTDYRYLEKGNNWLNVTMTGGAGNMHQKSYKDD